MAISVSSNENLKTFTQIVLIPVIAMAWLLLNPGYLSLIMLLVVAIWPLKKINLTIFKSKEA